MGSLIYHGTTNNSVLNRLMQAANKRNNLANHASENYASEDRIARTPESLVISIAKSIIYAALNDEKIEKALANWLQSFVSTYDDEISNAVSEILQSPKVTEEVKKLAFKVVSDLSRDCQTQQAVGYLFVQALYLEKTRENLYSWLCSMLNSDNFRDSLQAMIKKNILANDEVISCTRDTILQLVTQVLLDPAIMEYTRQHLSQVVSEEKFQSSASDAVWGVLKKFILLR